MTEQELKEKIFYVLFPHAKFKRESDHQMVQQIFGFFNEWLDEVGALKRRDGGKEYRAAYYEPLRLK